MPTDKQVREAIEAFVAKLRHVLDADVRSLTDELVRIGHQDDTQWRVEIDRAVSHARAEAEHAFAPRLEALRDELRKSQAISRLLAAVRRLDEARSLHAILDALTVGAPEQVERVAMLVVAGDRLRVWDHSGFAADSVPPDVTIPDAGVLRSIVESRQASFIAPAVEAQDASLPPFMQVPGGHTGFLLPVIVGTEVVAALYAVAADEPSDEDGAPAWTEELEVLVRHASLRLEIVTSVRTAELLTSPA
jgi:hypothetical protein